jgi:hypothetical protein
MSFPVNRTVYLVPPWQQSYNLPSAQPDDVLDYTLNFGQALSDAGDTVSSVLVSAAPSGAGELAVSNVSHTSNSATFWTAYGIAGRVYWVDVQVNTTNGRRFQFYLRLPFSGQLSAYPIPLPPNPGYSTPVSG